MLLFAICLIATLTSAQIKSYVECFSNEDCMKFYDNWYCYAGTCTDRCPPGYLQENYGAEPYFRCTCDTSKGFNVSDYFPLNYSGVYIPMCTCERNYCEILVYAAGIGYTNGLVPKGSPPNCKIKSDEIPSVLSEFIFFFVIGTMIIFTFINCRSASGVLYDFHRYIGLYVVASIAVIVFVQTVTPFTAGFTKTMGFGVIIHNSAEWNFLLRLHFGKKSDVRNATNMCVVLYYVLMLIAMVVLSPERLFLAAMIQGGFLDWALVFFIWIGFHNLKFERNWQYLLKNICTWSYGRFVWYAFAAVFHLVTVEILFIGFAMNSPVLIGMGSVFLVPTFFAYTFWAYGEDRVSLLCGPGLVMDYTAATDSNSDFSLTTFAHTTRTTDVMWQGFVGNRVIKFESGKTGILAEEDDPEVEMVKLIETDTKSVVIEDCENFKFGVYDTVKTLNRGGKYISWCPVYWFLALAVVTLNAIVIYLFPYFFGNDEWFTGCPTGFELGAW